VTGTVSFFADCASFQGAPDWTRVAGVCIGGAEKVTEGTGYANPMWAVARPAMSAAARHGFVPVAYLFLDAVEPGASQARYFAQKAGDLTGFGIVIDFERAPNGPPTLAQARDAVQALRQLYPRHPIGGYCPHWYTGGEDLTFIDWLWASEYVSGSGDPGLLYAQVPASWWAPYGGRAPELLQFTSAATVAGIAGPVDCSAFHGSQAQLAGLVLPAALVAAPAAVAAAARPGGDGSMLITLAPGDVPVTLPVWASAGSYKEPAAYGNCSLVLTGGAGAVVKVTCYGASGIAPEIFTVTLAGGWPHPVIPARAWSALTVIEVQRLDTKKSVPASATFRTW
jgi:GH25 family lysozyme M1 (1,4-beta-N-acetylmuramidase)